MRTLDREEMTVVAGGIRDVGDVSASQANALTNVQVLASLPKQKHVSDPVNVASPQVQDNSGIIISI